MPAADDDVADWYATWVRTDAAFTARADAALRTVLGAAPSSGRHPRRSVCWDLACGTGAHAAAVTALGWSLVGSDASTGQLRHARADHPRVPVLAADAAALPLPDACVGAVASVLCHTDVTDHAAACREAARVLLPGGRFAHVGVHPCFVGPHCDRSDPARWVLAAGYPYDEPAPPPGLVRSGAAVQARVGAVRTSLAHLLGAVLGAGLVIDAVHELGDGPAPDVLAVAAHRPDDGAAVGAHR